MAHKPTRAAAADSDTKKKAAAAQARPAKKPEPPKNGAPRQPANGATKARAPRSASDARSELAARATHNEEGATVLRSDPLADAQAVRRVVEFAGTHAAELSRRGLWAAYADAALGLAKEIEEHLKELPAQATAVRARSPETAELIADAAAMVLPAREAVVRVTRGAEGRRAAHAFGLGQAFNARLPHHVLRALRAVVSAAAEFPDVAADAGILPDDLRAMGELADELEALAAQTQNGHDAAAALHEAHAALRAYFDLVAAKATLAFAADPEERSRLLSLIPRGPERRHLRRAADQAPAA